MTDDEIIQWASLMVDAKLTRRQAIQDILDHSKGDGMSKADKIVCARAIKLIDEGVLRDHSPVAPRDPLRSGLSISDGLDGPEEIDLE